MSCATVNILCYGDSNTYGYCPTAEGERYPEEKRWTNIMARMLGDGYRVVPAGLNGRTTAYDWPEWVQSTVDADKNGLNTLPENLTAQERIDILIFMLGTNDCIFPLGLTAEDIAAGMEKLVSAAEKITRERQGFVPQIIVTAPAAIRPETEGSLFEDQLDKSSVEKSHAIVPLYEDIAKRHGGLFLNASGCEVLALDCEHLTEESHAKLAGMMTELISSHTGERGAVI